MKRNRLVSKDFCLIFGSFLIIGLTCFLAVYTYRHHLGLFVAGCLAVLGALWYVTAPTVKKPKPPEKGGRVDRWA